MQRIATCSDCGQETTLTDFRGAWVCAACRKRRVSHKIRDVPLRHWKTDPPRGRLRQ